LDLGEKIAEEKGKAISMSVKSVGPEGVHTEVSFVSQVKGFGRFPSGRDMGTISGLERPGGIFSGTAQGTKLTTDGDSVVWKAYIIGKVEGGKRKDLSIIEFMTTSQKLSWMNGFVAVEEAVPDLVTMEFSGIAYEWK